MTSNRGNNKKSYKNKDMLKAVAAGKNGRYDLQRINSEMYGVPAQVPISYHLHINENYLIQLLLILLGSISY